MIPLLRFLAAGRNTPDKAGIGPVARKADAIAVFLVNCRLFIFYDFNDKINLCYKL